jgi:LmbE family N-acetylglucosaminyl deacetylase
MQKESVKSDQHVEKKLMENIFGKLLFIGPHPDDVELGCGGTVARYSRVSEIKYLILSPCTEEVKNKNILDEAKRAIGILGVSRENLIIEKLPRRTFHEHRKKIREILISVRDLFGPTVVFCPSLKDVHQDHSVTAEETLRLFRDNGVVSYEAPRSSLFFQPNLYIKLNDEDFSRKMRALKCYRSQFDRYYFNTEVIRSLACMRGSQARVRYAEAFEVLRMNI